VKVQVASDLHLEFLGKLLPRERLISPAHGADLLVLAGDIGNGIEAVEMFKNWPVPVLYIAGNHEFYGHSLEQMRMDLRNAAAGTHVTFLDNDVKDFGGVRFLGTTLWTDYKLERNRTQRQLMESAGLRISDHCRIDCSGGKFTPERALAEHELSRAWLKDALNRPYDGRTVVVTHHGPHRLSVHPRYVGNPVNASFVSDLGEFLPKADLWIHGHVHDSFDYKVGGSRVIANPLGYALNRNAVETVKELVFENTHFQSACVISI
jgi:predicted phosphodiesterase